MLADPTDLLATVSNASIRTGTAEEVIEEAGLAKVRLDNAPYDVPLQAEIAMSGERLPTPGDRVLLVAVGPAEAFVIAVIGAKRPAAARDIALSDGSAVRISGDAPAQKLTLLSPDRRPLVEYDTRNGHVTLSVPAGDLELASHEGDIVLNAARSVRLRGRSIDATVDSHVRLGVEDLPDRTGSLLSLDPRSTRIATPNLTVGARRTKLSLEDMTYTGSQVTARVRALRLVAQRVERIADQVHDHVTSAYQTVSRLLEVRAERVRQLVKSSYRLRTKKAFLKSDEDFKIKGDSIHLG